MFSQCEFPVDRATLPLTGNSLSPGGSDLPTNAGTPRSQTARSSGSAGRPRNSVTCILETRRKRVSRRRSPFSPFLGLDALSGASLRGCEDGVLDVPVMLGCWVCADTRGMSDALFSVFIILVTFLASAVGGAMFMPSVAWANALMLIAPPVSLALSFPVRRALGRATSGTPRRD